MLNTAKFAWNNSSENSITILKEPINLSDHKIIIFPIYLVLVILYALHNGYTNVINILKWTIFKKIGQLIKKNVHHSLLCNKEKSFSVLTLWKIFVVISLQTHRLIVSC